jgi:3-oxoacyl-[acyl-carrier-protein] synthase-1/3-oxoacyl-[acyl-carrier-protein] synthase II
MQRAEPVRVSGLGCITAAGRNLAENLRSLEKGLRLPRPPESFRPDTVYPVFQCALPEPLFGLADPAALDGCSRTALLAAHAAVEALHDAGLAVSDLGGLRAGICLGTSVGASLDFFDYYRARREGKPAPADCVRTYFRSNPALLLARVLGVRGPVQTVVNACSSGADAIGLASQWLRDGRCDLALAGGADALSYITYLGFASLRLLSPEPCAPFDRRRKGLNLGEGAGVMVLEAQNLRLSPNPARGYVRGYGTATDAYHLTAPHPEARGLHKALRDSLAQAGTDGRALAFINAHGTATAANDAAEGAFFRRLFPLTPFIATKGCTGHTLGAAGAVEAVFTLAHLACGRLPASPGFTEPDPDMGVAPVRTPTNLDGELALSQSLAFGGNNSILLLGKGERHVD